MNKRHQKLAARKNALVQLMNEILDKAGDDSLDAQAEKDYAEHESELAQINAAIEREVRLAAVERSMGTKEDENRDDDRQERDRQGKEEDGSAGFSSFGDMLQAVARAEQPGSRHRPDPRLIIVPNDPRSAATGMNERIASEGGFLVDKDVVKTILRRTYETGRLAAMVRRIGISANSNGLKMNAWDETSRAHGSRMGGLRAYWTPEAGLKTASQPALRPFEMTLKKLTGVMYATDELLQDAPALEQIATEGFAEEFGFMLDDAILNGTGAGMPLGALKSGAAIEVAAEGGQDPASIVVNNVLNMWGRLPARSQTTAIWVANVAVQPQLFKMTIGGANWPVYLPPGGLASQPLATLMGRPIIFIEQTAALGNPGDLILFDPMEYLMIDKGPIQKATSIHVRFLYDETAFRFVYRVDGQPLWNSPVTPFDGSGNTLSPFIYLAART